MTHRRFVLIAGIACISLLVEAAAQKRTGRQRNRGRVFAQGAEEDIKLLARFDKDGDHVLDHAERIPAREFINANPQLRPPFRRGRAPKVEGSPGPKIAKGDVKTYPADVSLYDPGTLRTFFIDFAHDDWEDDMAAFWHTDVLVPATLTVDGKAHAKVGMAFRGNNSFSGVPKGLKRPLSIRMDAFGQDRTLLGHRKINLLNSNEDPTFLRSILYLQVARDYIPALHANLVRVVINGESWGIYVNQQTFSAEWEKATFGTDKGTRWKSPNNSTGGGLSFLGDDIARYRRWYEMKDVDDIAAWKQLIRVTKILDTTKPELLAKALAPVMNVDEVLRFLALDIVLVNNDGYWRDGSDFNVYLSEKGRFLLTPHDANEGFRIRGRRQPDPLAVLDDPNKALRRRLLVVPELRTRYLRYVGDIAEKWLDWQRLGPIVERYQKLIAADIAKDTRKLDTTAAFTEGVHGKKGSKPSARTLEGFADQRRAFLLAHPEVVKARGK